MGKRNAASGRDLLAGSDEWQEFSRQERTLAHDGRTGTTTTTRPTPSTGRPVSRHDDSRVRSDSRRSGRSGGSTAAIPRTSMPPRARRIRRRHRHRSSAATRLGTAQSSCAFDGTRVHGPRPWWEQAFSPDDGKHWEVNWRNYFRALRRKRRTLPKLANAPSDWDFLVGEWRVRHRRLRERLAGSSAWDELDRHVANWPVLGGHGNVGDNVIGISRSNRARRGRARFRSRDTRVAELVARWTQSARHRRAAARDVQRAALARSAVLKTVAGRTIRTRVQWSRNARHARTWRNKAKLRG